MQAWHVQARRAHSPRPLPAGNPRCRPGPPWAGLPPAQLPRGCPCRYGSYCYYTNGFYTCYAYDRCYMQTSSSQSE